MNLNVYTIHAQNLSVRKTLIENLVGKLNDSTLFNVNHTYITKHDPAEINIEFVKTLIKFEKINDELFDQFIRNMHIKQLSNILKHIEAIRMVMENTSIKDDDVVLVIEDDVIFTDDVATLLKNVIDNAKSFIPTEKSWDIIFMGFPQTIQDTSPNTFKRVSDHFRINPSSDSYIFRKGSAQKLLDAYLPIRFVNNVQMSYMASKCDVQCFFTTPNIFADGTKYGVYISTLDPNNKLFMNPDYNALLIAVNKDKILESDLDGIQTLIRNQKFSGHPDIIYQVALFLAKIGDFEKSKQYFEEAFRLYKTNDCIINNTSEFLMNYIRVFKFLQKDI